MREPNFFIIGAPKCGTTALSEYLREHPQVFFSDPKEPGYFNPDFPSRQHYKSEADYLKLFEQAGGQHSAVGEGSVHYLRSQVAVPRINERFPGSRFIVMLRDPVDFLPSWHSQQLRSLTENEPDFERAWRLTDDRREGRVLPDPCDEPSNLDYHAVAMFGEQVDRLLKTVERKQVMFIDFNAFVTDVKTIYDQVLKFLGLELDHRTEFPVINERRRVRSRMLGKGLSRVIRLRRRLGISDSNPLRKLAHEAAVGLKTLNSRPEPRPELDQNLRNEIKSFFEQDQEKLRSLIGVRDI